MPRNRVHKRRQPELAMAYDLNSGSIQALDMPKSESKRPRRVFVPGGVYHVRCYSNNRMPLFCDQEHHDKFDSLLREGIESFGHKILSYKKFKDHVHLVILVGDVFLADIMHDLCRRYAYWYNRLHGRTGHLFGDRYDCILIDRERYLTGLVAFVHAHGVRSGLVQSPEDDELSSYGAYLDPERAKDVPWLNTRLVLAHLGADPAVARRRLRASTLSVDPTIRYSKGSRRDRRFLGDEEFICRSLARALPLQ